LQCHNPWSGYALAFTASQLDRKHDYDGVLDNELRTLLHIGMLKAVTAPKEGDGPQPPAKLVNPHDESASLDDRARSYLHSNCSHCHQFGAGGTADIDLRREMALKQTKALDVKPVQGTFDITEARILAPGDPYRSVLYYRMAKLGRGRMPHIGSEIVDVRGLRLIHDWVRQLPHPPSKDANSIRDQLDSLGNKTLSEEQRKKAIDRLLASPESALMLLRAFDDEKVPLPVRKEVLAAAQSLPEPPVRDLFERFVPDDERVKRLGNLIQPQQLLPLRGDATRGRELFFKASVTQCVNCHKVGGMGSDLGPDLSLVGKKYDRAKILENILEPSKEIDEKYATYVVETANGKMYSGLLAQRTDKEVVLRDAANKETRIPADQVASVVRQKNSLMPEQLLRDLTAEQAADLLEFLSSLK
jgi:putative heme-binding domain-containing protein